MNFEQELHEAQQDLHRFKLSSLHRNLPLIGVDIPFTFTYIKPFTYMQYTGEIFLD